MSSKPQTYRRTYCCAFSKTEFTNLSIGFYKFLSFFPVCFDLKEEAETSKINIYKTKS